jgi:hypothetical protein
MIKFLKDTFFSIKLMFSILRISSDRLKKENYIKWLVIWILNIIMSMVVFYYV